MTTLHKAAQQALEALENTSPLGFNMESDKKFYAAIIALRAALAQQAEPVQHYASIPGTNVRVRLQPEPVQRCADFVPLYTTPPQRPPLTDEEIESCRQQGYAHAGLGAPFDFGKAARAVERKVRGE